MGFLSSVVRAVTGAAKKPVAKKPAAKKTTQAVQDRLSRMLKSTLDDGKKLTAAQKDFLSSLNPSDTKSKLMIAQIKRADEKITTELTTGRKSKRVPSDSNKRAGSRTSEAFPLEDSAVSVFNDEGKILSDLDSADRSIVKAGKTKRTVSRAEKREDLLRKKRTEKLTSEEEKFLKDYEKTEQSREIRARQAAGQTRKNTKKQATKEAMDVTTGDITNEAEYDKLTPNQKAKLANQAKFQKLRKETEGKDLQKNRRKQIRRELNSKPKMMGGGMVGKKVHMYAAGGSVTDNRKKK
jgi:hypothetical protein